MVHLDAEVLQRFLDSDANGTAATPDANQDVGPKTLVVNLCRQPKRIEQQRVGSNESLVHRGGRERSERSVASGNREYSARLPFLLTWTKSF